MKEVGFDGKLRIDIDEDGRRGEGRRAGVLLQPEQPDRHRAWPSGRSPTCQGVRSSSPDTVILIDEAYHDYVDRSAYQSAIDIALSTPERVRDADLLEGLRDGRAARRLRDRPAGHHQEPCQTFKTPYGLSTLTLGGALVALGNQPHIDEERAATPR